MKNAVVLLLPEKYYCVYNRSTIDFQEKYYFIGKVKLNKNVVRTILFL